MSTLLIVLGTIIWIYAIVMVVNFKKHPRLTLATVIILVLSLMMIPGTDFLWIGLVVAHVVNNCKQRSLAAL